MATSTSSRTVSSMAARYTLNATTTSPAATRPMPTSPPTIAPPATATPPASSSSAGTASIRPIDRASGIGAIATVVLGHRLRPSR